MDGTAATLHQVQSAWLSQDGSSLWTCDASARIHPQIDQSRDAVQSPSLDFACLVVVNGNDRDGTTVCWNHDLSCVCLQRARNHVLDGISVPGCNDEV